MREVQTNPLVEVLLVIRSLADRALSSATAAREDQLFTFLTAQLKSEAGVDTSADAIWVRFTTWWRATYPATNLPTRKRLGTLLRAAGFAKVKRGGRVVYLDTALI